MGGVWCLAGTIRALNAASPSQRLCLRAPSRAIGNVLTQTASITENLSSPVKMNALNVANPNLNGTTGRQLVGLISVRRRSCLNWRDHVQNEAVGFRSIQ